MRVLLTTAYDLAVPGGVNRHALELLDALSARGHEVKLLAPASAPVFSDNPRIATLGRVSQAGLNGAVSRVTLDLTIAPRVRRIVREFRPDVVHVQEPFLPTLNTFALWFAGGARRVGTFHTFAEKGHGYLWTWPWCDWVNGLLDVRIAVSPAAREYAARFHPADYVVIDHGIALPPPERMRAAGPVRRPVRLLMVGRVGEPRKGYAVLRAALAQLHRASPGAFDLTVVGPDRPPDDPGVRWRGRVDADALSRCYAEADLVVVPSLGGESFGLVPLEALAHGVPVVASHIRGYADWIPAGVGDAVPPGDATALADAIRRLAAEPARFAACAARARLAAERFDCARQIDRLLAVYAGSSNELGAGHISRRNDRTVAITSGLGLSR
jgi:phosphatidylinositol alpha-mannosyltransferase